MQQFLPTFDITIAILEAQEALEKPIRDRDNRDIYLIDKLCSQVRGFSIFTKPVRRALAQHAVLAVIDQTGKELIIHNEILDSYCVLIYGICEQLDPTKTKTLRTYNIGDAFGVCEHHTNEIVRFHGYMRTIWENCAFLCVKRDDFFSILSDPANYPNKEIERHRDKNGNVYCVSKKSTLQTRPDLSDGHIITRATEECLLNALVNGYDKIDPNFVEDFLILFRVFLTYEQVDKEKNLPPGMTKLCSSLISWLDYEPYRDRIIKIVLFWTSYYYHDFELNNDFSYLFFKELEAKLLQLSMNDQLHLLHITLSARTKNLPFTMSGIIDKNYPSNSNLAYSPSIKSANSKNNDETRFKFSNLISSSKHIVKQLRDFTSKNQDQLSESSSEATISGARESPPIVTLTSLNANFLAAELTLMDFDKFKLIEPQQFVYDTFFDYKENPKKPNPNLYDTASLQSSSSDSQETDLLSLLNKTRTIPKDWMVEFQEFADISNKEMFWVICEILSERNIDRRVKIIKHFITVADVCLKLKNYNSMFAIISGLGHNCVTRLKKTFEKLKPKYKDQLDQMSSLFDPSRNMQNYRLCLSQTPPPAIPLFPQIKKDLTFSKEGRSIFVKETNDPSDDEDEETAQQQQCITPTPRKSKAYSRHSILINFSEIRQFKNKISEITLFSSVPYPNDLMKIHEDWQMHEKIRNYVQETFYRSDKIRITYDERVLLARSLEVEPDLNKPQLPRPAALVYPEQKHEYVKPPAPFFSNNVLTNGRPGKFGTENLDNIRKLKALSTTRERESSQTSQ